MLKYKIPQIVTLTRFFIRTTALKRKKKVCQNAPLLSFTHKAPTFTSWGFVIT